MTKDENRFLSRETWTALGFLLPLAGFVVVFILVPVLGTLTDSFFLDVTYRPRRFLGADNFIWMFNDPGFRRALRFTGLFVLVSVPLEVVLGLIIALVLNERLPLRGLIRAAVLVPWAIPAVVSGRIFELIYNYSYGLANYLLTTMHLTQGPVNWLGSEIGAFLALVAADSWKTTPFAAIILLAGLSAIPADLYRQAKVDRADVIQRFFKITVPLSETGTDCRAALSHDRGLTGFRSDFCADRRWAGRGNHIGVAVWLQLFFGR